MGSSTVKSMGRRFVAVLALMALGACGGDDDLGGIEGGDAGEVAALDYEVTPERYEQWRAAQQALDAAPGLGAAPTIDPMRLDEGQIERAVEYLEGNADARAALQRAGISARDYVLTTAALDQALVAASGGQAATDPGSSPAAAATPSGGGASPATPRRRAPRVTGAPSRNVDLVRRNRDELIRVMRTMRFRIAETAGDEVATDTAVTKSDSVRVGKDVTVKWDVTVKRQSDSTKADGAKARSTPADTTKPDSDRR